MTYVLGAHVLQRNSMVPINAEGFQHCQHQAALETKPLARAGSRLLDSRSI